MNRNPSTLPSVTSQPQHIGLGRPTGKQAKHRVSKIGRLVPISGAWLDIGCGAGDYAALLLDRGCDTVAACDWQAYDEWAELDRKGLTFAKAPAESLPFEDETFDGILLNEVLEHVADERKTLAEARRVLKRQGHLVLFSPNRWFPFEGHGAKFGHHEVGFPVPFLPWLPKRLGNRWMNARNYWPGELRLLVTGAGFEPSYEGFAYPLFQEYPWLPASMARAVRSAAPRLEETPGIRRLGVSILIIAQPVS